LETGDAQKRKYCLKLLCLNEEIFNEYYLEWSETQRLERLRKEFNKFEEINKNYFKFTK
jgi:hypothetical protein